MSAVLEPMPADVRERFAAARSKGLRAKDAAEHLGLSEGAAIAAHVGADGALQATPLRSAWLEILQGLEVCGPVMALTRNPSVVHEKTGVYRNVSGQGPMMAIALDADIDLRLFFRLWHVGYAVQEAATQPGNLPQQSLQFFNAHGVAVHKVFVRDATDRTAWNALVARFADAAAAPAVFGPAPAPKAVRADAEVDGVALASDWGAMQDTHEFFGLLQNHNAERQQSFRLVQERFAWRLDRSAIRVLLDEAALEATPIMVFVGSGGCIQIHSGPVQRVEPMVRGDVRWLNVLDPAFNLHLREDHIDTVWRVEKPTADGIVTSIEVFDAAGELMAMFFGVRKPGEPELTAWRDLVGCLPAALNRS